MPDRPLVRRRTAVGGALGGLALTMIAAGCDPGEDLAPPEDDATPTPSGAPDQPTPDEALVDEVSGDLVAALGVLGDARKFRSLRKPLAPLARAHRAHLEVLEGEVNTATGSETHANASLALLAVHASERALQVSLVDAATRAESGALARLLASMSASVTQHLAVLPREVAP